MHDATVDRTTDGTGPIAGQTLEELRTLDAGRGERIPVFEEVLDAVTAPLQAEIKDVAAAQRLAEVLLRRELVGRVEVISFHAEAVEEIARLVPGVRTALVASRYDAEVVDRAVRAGARTMSLNIRRLTLETVERARQADLRVLAWTVNTPEQLRLAHAFGLDGVVTDRPEIRRG
jgi:glycerophosphoryl diester phosphodiesterase